MSTPACANCGRNRSGSRYGFHYGVAVSTRREPEFSIVEYRILGHEYSFLCHVCTAKRVFWYAFPLLVSMSSVVLLAVGTPFAAIGWGSGGLIVFSLLAWIAATTAAGLGWRAVSFSRSGSRPVATLGSVFKIAVWVVASCIGPVALIHAGLNHGFVYEAPSVLDVDSWPPEFLTWFVAVTLGAQAVMLLVVAASWPIYMETVAARRNIRRLSGELDEPRLVAFNSGEYRRLRFLIE